jgi:hypothetical protein
MQRLGNDSDGTIGNATKKIGYKLLYTVVWFISELLGRISQKVFQIYYQPSIQEIICLIRLGRIFRGFLAHCLCQEGANKSEHQQDGV